MSYSLCTTCFRLTDVEKITSQRCKCQEQLKQVLGTLDSPSGVHLCIICARNLAGGFSRYSWEACEICRSDLAAIQNICGRSLPFGRHSFMNRIFITVYNFQAHSQRFMSRVFNWFELTDAMFDYGAEITEKLFNSTPEWKGRSLVTLDEWQEKFPPSTEISLLALRGFWEAKLNRGAHC